jgi:phage terminase large subunit
MSSKRLNKKDMSFDVVCELWKRGDVSYFIPDCGFDNYEMALKMLLNPDVQELLYGGAAGGGKSFLGVNYIWMECATKPGINFLIGRKELSNLRKTISTTVKEFCSIYNIPARKLFKYDGKDNIYKFYNGSRVILSATMYKPSDVEYNNFGSWILSGAWLEEGQESPAIAYDTLAHTRIGRQYDLNRKYGYPLTKMLITANPDKGWLFNNFYIPWKDGTLPKHKNFIKALARDNPFGEEYVKRNLSNIEDPVQRARLLDGDWEYEENKFQLFKHQDVMPMLSKTASDYNKGQTFITVDPSGQGKDLCVIWVWNGFNATELHIASKAENHETIARINMLEQKYGAARCNTIVDSTGIGYGVGSDLFGCTQFISKKGAYAQEGDVSLFPDVKTQTYYAFSEKVKEGMVTIDRNLHIDFFGTTHAKTRERFGDRQVREMIRAELEAIVQTSKAEDKKYKLISKADLKKKIGRSNDLTDALAMRFIKEIRQARQYNYEYRSAPVIELKSREELEFEKMVAGF